MSTFRRAIVRAPAPTFAAGLTTAGLGAPEFERTSAQHEAYCRALVELGLELTRLPADPAFPDSTFVEDTAVLSERCAVLTRPGAPSRAGEVDAVATALARSYEELQRIEEPGTLDGGDVCAAGEHVFIGISQRTNEEGARQLAELLSADGHSCALVDIRPVPGVLHLKSALAHLGGKELLVTAALATHPALHGWKQLQAPRDEEYAANCVAVNGRLLVAAGFPGVSAQLAAAGHRPLALEMSEFQKQDGGLSCLSLRF